MTDGSPAARIPFEAPRDVRAVLETLGRTEDLRFAPSGRRLAIASFENERIVVADVQITGSASGPEVAVTAVEQLASSSLREPHGLDFIDEETLVVANRGGGVAVLRLPPAGSTDGVARIEPLSDPVQEASDGPGSVVADSHASARAVLVCNNWTSTITRHAVAPGGTLSTSEVVARNWLDRPDGIALSRDGRWLASSNHNLHSVLVHEYPTAEDADPVAILRGVLYPHGLRFHADDRYLLVADAGRPCVHVFTSPDHGWRGVLYAEATIRVMDDGAFSRGRYNPTEGGPKGIDVHPGTHVLAVTAKSLPLAFIDLESALARAAPAEPPEVLLQHELDLLEIAGTEERSQLVASRLKIALLTESLGRQGHESPGGRRAPGSLRAVAGRLRRPRSQ
jgi:DNA-binding beta-propeller fold protein YncE